MAFHRNITLIWKMENRKGSKKNGEGEIETERSTEAHL
jgi:hypothetical protein